MELDKYSSIENNPSLWKHLLSYAIVNQKINMDIGGCECHMQNYNLIVTKLYIKNNEISLGYCEFGVDDVYMRKILFNNGEILR